MKESTIFSPQRFSLVNFALCCHNEPVMCGLRIHNQQAIDSRTGSDGPAELFYIESVGWSLSICYLLCNFT